MQKWIMYICISMAVGSIFYMLIPNKNMKNTMKFVINLFIVSNLAIPIVNCSSNLNFSSYNEYLKSTPHANCSKDMKLEFTKQNLKNALKFVLKQNGYKNVDVSIDINMDNKVSNINIKIPKNQNYDSDSIKNIIKAETGIIPKICYC